MTAAIPPNIVSQFLSANNIACVIVIAIVLPCVWQVIYYRYFHPLAKFPGPALASVTRIWLAWQCYIAQEPYVLFELAQKYGPVVRITPTMLHVSDATMLPTLYARNADKSGHYLTGSFGNTESIFHMQKTSTHTRFRKLIAGPYTLTNLKKIEPLIDLHTTRWMDRLEEMYVKSSATFDFAPWAVFWAYDVISEVAFGAPFGFVKAGNDVDDIIKNYHAGLHVFGLMGRLYPLANLAKKIPWLGPKFFIATSENDDGIGQIMRFRDGLVEKRLKDIKEGTLGDRKDLLQSLLEVRTDDGKPLDIEHIKTEAFIIIIAGADTVGTTIQALIKYIIESESVYDRVMAELDDATKRGLLSSTPQFAEVLEHCPYYMACVKETQRLCPPAPTLFPRLVGKGGLDLYGKFAPAGTEVTANPWVVHRDQDIYGEDYEEFKPERWLESEELTTKYQKYQFGFGYGARICLGKEFARMELYKGPLQFLRKFRPVIDRTKPPKYHIEGGESWFTEMNMRLERR